MKNCVFVLDQFLRVQLRLAAAVVPKVELWFIVSKVIRYCWFDDSCSVFSEGFAGSYHTKVTKDCCTIKSDNKQTKDVIIWFSFRFCFFGRNFLADVFNFLLVKLRVNSRSSSRVSTLGLRVELSYLSSYSQAPH